MSYTADPNEDPREKADIAAFVEALRQIRAESGWGKIYFELNEGDISFHDVTVRRTNKRKRPDTKAV